MNTVTKSATIESERAFHNRRALEEDSPGERLSYVYSSMFDVLNLPIVELRKETGAVLEVGCYLGENAALARNASSYVGIDISDIAIQKAEAQGLGPHAKFLCVDANVLEELDGQFDYVFGNGVIHHLDLERFAEGLRSKLKDGGRAVFIEPMQGPIWLRLFRMLTPRLRTEDEHPLDSEQLDILRRYFDLDIQYFGITRPVLPMLMLNAKFAIRFSAWVDRILTRTRFGRGYAWLVAITFRAKGAAHSPEQ